jgi:hypothetical protein
MDQLIEGDHGAKLERLESIDSSPESMDLAIRYTHDRDAEVRMRAVEKLQEFEESPSSERELKLAECFWIDDIG